MTPSPAETAAAWLKTAYPPLSNEVRDALAHLVKEARERETDAIEGDEPGSQEFSQQIVREARAVLDRLVTYSPDHGVDEFLDAIRDARLLVARIDGAE